MQQKCIARPAAEEWNLAANAQTHDVTGAGFIRTFMSIDFPGGQLVRRLEAEKLFSQARTVPRQRAGDVEGN